jgi:hypothetical protein
LARFQSPTGFTDGLPALASAGEIRAARPRTAIVKPHLALDLGGHLAVLHVLDHPAHPLLEAKVRALHLHRRSDGCHTKKANEGGTMIGEEGTEGGRQEGKEGGREGGREGGGRGREGGRERGGD